MQQLSCRCFSGKNYWKNLWTNNFLNWKICFRYILTIFITLKKSFLTVSCTFWRILLKMNTSKHGALNDVLSLIVVVVVGAYVRRYGTAIRISAFRLCQNNDNGPTFYSICFWCSMLRKDYVDLKWFVLMFTLQPTFRTSFTLKTHLFNHFYPNIA